MLGLGMEWKWDRSQSPRCFLRSVLETGATNCSPARSPGKQNQKASNCCALRHEHSDYSQLQDTAASAKKEKAGKTGTSKQAGLDARMVSGKETPKEAHAFPFAGPVARIREFTLSVRKVARGNTMLVFLERNKSECFQS